MDPCLRFILDEIHRKFDEIDARWEHRFTGRRAVKEQRDSAVEPDGTPRLYTAAQLHAPVVADNWGDLFIGDGGSVATSTGVPVVADNWSRLFDEIPAEHVYDQGTTDSAHTSEDHTLDLFADAVFSELDLDLRDPPHPTDGNKLNLSVVDTAPAQVFASAAPSSASSATHSAHFLTDTPTLLSAWPPTTEHIYPDLNVDRMGKQSYWCYADPRCSVPLLGHRPSCGRPPPEQHGVDAAEPTRLDTSSPPPLLLDMGDPMPPCLAPPPPQPPAVTARLSRLTTTAPFPICTVEMGLVSMASSADIGLQQVTKVLAGSIPTQAAADGSDIYDALAFSLHLAASTHVFPTPHQPQLDTEEARWTAPPSVGVDPSAISTTADTVKLRSTFVGSCLDIRVPLSKFTSPAVNVELASNTEDTTTKASPTRCSTYVRTRVRGNTLMLMTLKVNLPSASIAEIFINMMPSTTSVPSFSNIISNHAMAAPGPLGIMFADAIESVQCWPVNVIVVVNTSLSVSLDTQGVLDDMLSKCIQSCSWPPFSCSWDAVPHRQQWPPPVQFGMQGGDVHLRPTPWASFSSLTSWCGAYSVKKCLVQLLCCKISGEYWQHWYAIVEITELPAISAGLVPEISVWNMELVWGLRSESRQQKRGGAFTEQIVILSGMCRGYDFPNKSSSSIWDPGGLQLLVLVSMAGCVLTQEQVHWKCGDPVPGDLASLMSPPAPARSLLPEGDPVPVRALFRRGGAYGDRGPGVCDGRRRLRLQQGPLVLAFTILLRALVTDQHRVELGRASDDLQVGVMLELLAAGHGALDRDVSSPPCCKGSMLVQESLPSFFLWCLILGSQWLATWHGARSKKLNNGMAVSYIDYVV